MAMRDLAQEVDSLSASIAEIRQSLAGLPGRLEGAASYGERGLRRAGRAVGHAADEAAGRALEGVDMLEDEIGTHPIIAVGLAFIAGMAVDRFLLR
jgi:ElaB/YqjD/DUF883 family membrane-anchored ribosome-binding protein